MSGHVPVAALVLCAAAWLEDARERPPTYLEDARERPPTYIVFLRKTCAATGPAPLRALRTSFTGPGIAAW